MTVVGQAPAPHGFVEFCARQPADCAVTPTELAQMRRAASHVSTAAAAVTYDWTAAFAEQRRLREQAAAPAAALPAALTFDWSGAFVQARAGRGAAPAPLPAGNRAQPASAQMNGKTWALLTGVNESINRAIAQRSDQDIYGVSELWTTPLQAGVRVGDCEDYVLEKRRALISAGLPASALSIAVVTTDRGLSHAVLVVATDKGDYVLDNLSAWVLPWVKTGYQWRERQVDGSASRWAFAAAPEPTAPSGLLLASLR